MVTRKSVYFLLILVLSTVHLLSAQPLVVSAYEYDCSQAHFEGKLQNLYVDIDHNNMTVQPGCSWLSLSKITAFPYGEKLLLVVTVDPSVDLSCVTGIRWSFMENSRRTYGGKYGVEVSIIKGAGVAESQIPASADQIITKLGVGPVYPPLPQAVYGLLPNSGEPVDEIAIKANQSWVIVRAFEPGVSKVLVSTATGKNVVSPEIEYAVNWTAKCSPLKQKQDLQVNVVEHTSSSDPFTFSNATHQFINYSIEVKDISDYYQNPTASCVPPILYPPIDYNLRFRIDPLQNPLGGTSWPDAYWVDWGLCSNTIRDNHYFNRLNWELNGLVPPPPTPYLQRTVWQYKTIIPTVNGAKPGKVQKDSTYVVFKAYNDINGTLFYYYRAKERSVDASLDYWGNSFSDSIATSFPGWYRDINDESTTIEYQPDEKLGGLEVTWNNSAASLRNQGGTIYVIYAENSAGTLKWLINPYLTAGTISAPGVTHGDWIYYQTITNNNTGSGHQPVIARQVKVRVQ